MKENVVRGILAKVEGDKFVGIETVEFPSKHTILNVMYKVLDCDCVDHVSLPIGDRVFHLWVACSSRGWMKWVTYKVSPTKKSSFSE